MSTAFTAAAVVGGLLAAGTVGSVIGAKTLFNKVIPRQDQLRVDVGEMADADKWSEYMNIITPNKEWLFARKMEHVTIKLKDNLTLHGDYIPADGNADTLVICFHGYTGMGLKDCVSISTFFLKQGYDCLVVDNRAHGKSEGDFVGFGILDRFDCIEWIRYIEKRFEGKKKILLYGVSMGASTVLMASGTEGFPESVKAVIADCAFTSPFDVFAHIMKRDYHMPPFPMMNISDMMCSRKAGYKFKDFSTIEALKKTTCPVLFIHGKEDTFVPTHMSIENFEACTAPKKLLLVDNAGHAASYYQDVKLYEKTVNEFLDEHAE